MFDTPAARARDIGLSSRETKQFSLVRLINALAGGPHDRVAQEAARFELEAVEAAGKLADAHGRSRMGYPMPNPQAASVSLPGEVARDLVVGTPGAGAELVDDDLRPGSFINLLRNRLQVFRAGATMLTGLVGNPTIPKLTQGSAAFWVSENQPVTESDPQFTQVTMRPHHVGARTAFSRQLMLQSTPDAEVVVRNDLANVLAEAIDLAALYGTAADGQPRGVANTVGVATPGNFAGALPTFVELMRMPGAVAVSNALLGSAAFILNPADAWQLSALSTDTGSGRFIFEPVDPNTGEGRIGGLRALVSAQVQPGEVFFGAWSSLLIGMWGGLDILVDPYSSSGSRSTRVVAFQTVDMAVRHAESFAISSTASE